MAPFQLVLFLLHAHGMPEERLTEAYHFIRDLLLPKARQWFITPYPKHIGDTAMNELARLQGSHPSVKALRERILLTTFTEAFGGDSVRAQTTLSHFLTPAWLS
jgi:hypothetical protein